jgi:hypothetical protein
MESKMSIEERIVESGLFSFDDGYLGSSNYGVGYYYNCNEEDIKKIKNEWDLKSLILDKDYFDEDENENNWDEFFDEWFGDCNEFEIIEDILNGGKGYGKIIVDKVNKSIKIMVVPCLYSKEEDDIKIFGFDWESGELVREISDEELSKMLEDKDYYIS